MRRAANLTLILLAAGMLTAAVAAGVEFSSDAPATKPLSEFQFEVPTEDEDPLPLDPFGPKTKPRRTPEKETPAEEATPEAQQEEIQAAIERYVEGIIGYQAPDGSFQLVGVVDVKIYDKLDTAHADYARDYPVGQTALGLLALEYARPHLSGDLLKRALQCIQKAEAYIVKHAIERKTYSAGLVITALAMRGPERFRKTLGDYASMLVASQHKNGEFSGQWGYYKEPWGDNSNNQFGLLGLYMASRAGFQTPRQVWELAAEHYLKTQKDGGWGYRLLEPEPSHNMTAASTVSLYLCQEMLLSSAHAKCEPLPHLKPIDDGLKWISEHWTVDYRGNGYDWFAVASGVDTYGLYVLERLGILTGRANIGGHDWYNDGADALLRAKTIFAKYTQLDKVAECFALIFLARGQEPVAINKLDRGGAQDWNTDPCDVQHLVDHLQDHYQQAVQWRIVTLEAPLDLLLKTPILFISGHEKLSFTDDEKAKLKAYVEGGGTILGEACCAKKGFADSFRALVKEVFGDVLRPLSAKHSLFETIKKNGAKKPPVIECLPLDKGQGRPAILFLPADSSCRWHKGGPDARDAYEAGAGIYLWVSVDGRKMFEAANSAAVP